MINFTKDGQLYKTEFESSGSDLIQIESNNSTVWVFSKIEDANSWDNLKTYCNLYNQTIQINLKEGVKIKLVSTKPAKFSIIYD